MPSVAKEGQPQQKHKRNGTWLGCQDDPSSPWQRTCPAIDKSDMSVSLSPTLPSGTICLRYHSDSTTGMIPHSGWYYRHWQPDTGWCTMQIVMLCPCISVMDHNLKIQKPMHLRITRRLWQLACPTTTEGRWSHLPSRSTVMVSFFIVAVGSSYLAHWPKKRWKERECRTNTTLVEGLSFCSTFTGREDLWSDLTTCMSFWIQ